MACVAAVAMTLYALLRRHRKRPTHTSVPLSNLQDNSLGRARRSRFRSERNIACYCTTTVPEYKAAAAAMVQPGDLVLEIGCQLNATTKMLSLAAASVVGIDIARKPPSKGKQSSSDSSGRVHESGEAAGMPNVTFHVLDVWDLTALHAAIADAGGQIDVVVLDPTTALGHDLLYEILALIRVLEKLAMPSRGVLVKSKALCALQHSLSPSPARRLAASHLGRPDPRVRLIGANGVADYREAAWDVMNRARRRECSDGDMDAAAIGAEPAAVHLSMRVLEIGAFEGATVALLASRGATACFGVDVSLSIIERGRRRYPHIRLGVADAWDESSLDAALEAGSGWRERFGTVCPELICVDVGGLSGASGTLDALALLKQLCIRYRSSLQAVVIKSSCVRALATSLRTAQELLVNGTPEG